MGLHFDEGKHALGRPRIDFNAVFLANQAHLVPEQFDPKITMQGDKSIYTQNMLVQ